VVPILICALSFGADDRAEWHFGRASRLAQQGKLDEAEHEYRLGLKISSSPEAYNNLGAIYFKKQHLPEAIGAFKRAHRLEPDNSEFSFNLGLALYQAGESLAAIPYLTAGARSQDHVSDAHYLLGACYFELEKWQPSIDELELARKQGFESPEGLFLLVYAYRHVGKPEKSLSAAAEFLQRFPDSPLVHVMLGDADISTSQRPEAEEEFKKAIMASPRTPRLHFFLGYLYWMWNRYGEAIAPLREEVRISPNFPPCYFYLGDIALRQGKADQALEDFEKAAELDPSYGEAYLGMGRADVSLGRDEEAISSFRRAAQLLPDKVDPHYWLGRTLMRVGRTEEGQREFAIVDRINSMRRPPLQDTETYRRATGALHVGNTTAPH
jgi:tetratricopeptide (TPR) repeat protein